MAWTTEFVSGSVSWEVDTWVADTEYKSEDLKDIIQAWLDRAAYLPDDWLAIILNEGDAAANKYQQAWSYFQADGAGHPEYAAELEINYDISEPGWYESIANAIRGRFETQIEDVEGIDVQYDNQPPITKPDDALWVRLAVNIRDTGQKSIGDQTQKRYRCQGEMVASIYIPLTQGDQPALALADKIADAFRTVTDTDVTFKTPTMSTEGREGNEWRVDVSCPFYSDGIL